MRSTPPTRIPADVYASAATVAALDSRTVPQQIAHWARIGREFEASPQVNHRAVAQVLAGDGSYDLLGEHEQAIVRGTWSERISSLRAGLNFEAKFKREGESFSEADADGNVVIRPGTN